MRLLFFRLLLAIFAAIPIFVSAAFSEPIDLEKTVRRLSSNVQVFTLKNGLRVIMYRRGTAPVFSGYIVVRVGGVDEFPGSTGLSHMLEHMAFKGTTTLGTKDYPREKLLLDETEALMHKKDSGAITPAEDSRLTQIQKELKEIWVQDTFDIEYKRRGVSSMNARTGKEFTDYFADLSKTHFRFWCWIESERLVHPVMRQFYQERDVVMEERRERFEDNPIGRLYEAMLGTAYERHPYRNPVIGYSQDIRKLTATMAKQLHEKYYVPKNMVIGLVGDVDPERDLPVVEKYFGRIKDSPAPELPKVVEPEQRGQRTVEVKLKSSPQLGIAYHKPQYPHPEDPAIGVMEHILTGSTLSPLYTQLVEEQKVAVNVSVNEEPGIAYPNLILFGLVPRAPHTNQAVLRAFDSVVEKFKVSGPTDEELEMAKRAMSTDLLGAFKSNQTLAHNFASNELIYGRWDASLDWLEKALKVTREDVIRAAKTYLVPERRTLGFVETDGGAGHE